LTPGLSSEATAGRAERAEAYARTVLRTLLGNRSVQIGGGLLLLMIAIALLAPFLGTVSPTRLDTTMRLRPPGAEAWMGTDPFGRDIYSRVIYGARISLVVGLTVAVTAVFIGTILGILSGYIRWLDGILMRVMDGLMAIPAILLAIAMVAVLGAGVGSVIIAITIPEMPRVVRLVRSVVLSVREEPYVEAAIALGTPSHLIMVRHILPNTLAPLLVQGTYICAFAILIESILSFLGAGVPPTIPTWGNIMAEGRIYFQISPWNIFFPAAFLAATVLAVNILGDGLRDTLDPRLQRGM
jgi:peptide/nickel transport system permease protein